MRVREAFVKFFFLCEVGFDFLAVGVVVRKRSVDLSQGEMPELIGDLLGCQSMLIMDHNAAHRDSRSGQNRSTSSDLRIPRDERANVHGLGPSLPIAGS